MKIAALFGDLPPCSTRYGNPKSCKRNIESTESISSVETIWGTDEKITESFCVSKGGLFIADSRLALSCSVWPGLEVEFLGLASDLVDDDMRYVRKLEPNFCGRENSDFYSTCFASNDTMNIETVFTDQFGFWMRKMCKIMKGEFRQFGEIPTYTLQTNTCQSRSGKKCSTIQYPLSAAKSYESLCKNVGDDIWGGSDCRVDGDFVACK